MLLKGELRKMPAQLNGENCITYQFALFDTQTKEYQTIALNAQLGKEITLHFTGNIFCKNCGRPTPTSYQQGFCYSCMMNAPEAAECIIYPERCQAHLGKGRDVDWELKHHNQPHFVYLATVDVVKVGVTRATQIPTRWIDQGASQAIQLAQTPNRHLAGLIEVALKTEFSDKTNWRKMLRNDIDENIDLEEVKWRIEELLPSDLSQYITEEDQVTHLQFPVLSYPEKIKTVHLEKVKTISGKLQGIKGQYLIFDKDRVLNINRHTSYQIEITIT